MCDHGVITRITRVQQFPDVDVDTEQNAAHVVGSLEVHLAVRRDLRAPGET